MKQEYSYAVFLTSRLIQAVRIFFASIASVLVLKTAVFTETERTKKRQKGVQAEISIGDPEPLKICTYILLFFCFLPLRVLYTWYYSYIRAVVLELEVSCLY